VAGGKPACAKQFGVPGRRSRGFRIERMDERGCARDPPAHPRAAQVRRSAKPHQPAGRAAALRSDGEPPGRGKIERFRVAPDLADHAGKRRASYALFHRPQRVTGVSRLDMDEVLRRQSGWMDSPGFENRHAVLHPEQGLVGRHLRQQEPRPAAVAWMLGEELAQGRPGRLRQSPSFAQIILNWAFFDRTAGAAGDQGQTTCHTTHNAFVLYLFLSGESDQRVNGTTRPVVGRTHYHSPEAHFGVGRPPRLRRAATIG